MWIVLVWFCKSVLPTNTTRQENVQPGSQAPGLKNTKTSSARDLEIALVWHIPATRNRCCRLPQPLEALQPPTFPRFIHFNFLCSHPPGSSSKTMAKPKVSRHPERPFGSQGTWQVFGCHSYLHPWLINRGISVWHCNSTFMKTLPHLVEYSWGTAFHFLILYPPYLSPGALVESLYRGNLSIKWKKPNDSL